MRKDESQPILRQLTIRELGVWSAWLLDVPLHVIRNSDVPQKEDVIGAVVDCIQQLIIPELYTSDWGAAPQRPYPLDSLAEGLTTLEYPLSACGYIVHRWVCSFYTLTGDAIEERRAEWSEHALREFGTLDSTLRILEEILEAGVTSSLLNPADSFEECASPLRLWFHSRAPRQSLWGNPTDVTEAAPVLRGLRNFDLLAPRLNLSGEANLKR